MSVVRPQIILEGSTLVTFFREDTALSYRYRYNYRYAPKDNLRSEPERRGLALASGLMRALFVAFMAAVFLFVLIRVFP